MSRWLSVVLVVVLLAGCLFGYDQGVIAGALAGIQSTFALSLLMVQVVTSWVTLGALAGSLLAGELGDRLGRKRTLLVASACFALGAVLEAAAPDAVVLVLGRLVVGVGVGVAAVAAPLYAAEMAPSSLRGRFVSTYQLAIAAGIFLAYLINARLSANASWRTMLSIAAVPGFALLVVSLVAPESPRWLLMKGRRRAATTALQRLTPGVDVEPAIEAMIKALRVDTHPAGWSELFDRAWRRPLLVGLGLAVLQQVTGINAVIYYAGQIFAAAGISTESARVTMTTWAIGGVNVVATLIAVAFIDRIGRRRLLLAGLIGMGASLATVAVAFHFIPTPTPDHAAAVATGSATQPAGLVMVVALVVFIASFACSLGPVAWTVINEIFPAHIRSRGVALATAVNWGAAWLLSQFFLSMVATIGSAASFLVLSLICGVGWIWVYRRLPETKGIALEEIEALWKAHP